MTLFIVFIMDIFKTRLLFDDVCLKCCTNIQTMHCNILSVFVHVTDSSSQNGDASTTLLRCHAVLNAGTDDELVMFFFSCYFGTYNGT